MKEFAGYVKRIAALVDHFADGRRNLKQAEISPALDGEPSSELRRLVGVDERRRDGVFFTGSVLAERVAASLEGQISRESVITDPACGAGDLLLACAKHFPKFGGLRETLDAWSHCLRGSDIHSEFVRLARLRLVLSAMKHTPRRHSISESVMSGLFANIQAENGLAKLDRLKSSTHIVTNPPFCLAQTPPECTWSSGSVNLAAIFMDVVSDNIEAGTRVYAILPDVLRSGSRYAKWRQLISQRFGNISVRLIGQFSSHADVDVFLMEAKKRSKPLASQPKSVFGELITARKGVTVGDRFSVHVGPVVPFRDEHKGNWRPFLTPHDCPPWGTVTQHKKHRRFKGTVYAPPFVVVRRTSRSDDRQRAIGTVVLGDRQVAVENHLLLLSPISGCADECRKLLEVLKAPSTNAWLNHRMCCRHLTVSSVKAIPWNQETV